MFKKKCCFVWLSKKQSEAKKQKINLINLVRGLIEKKN